MIVDTSALMALILKEDGYETLLEVFEREGDLRIAAGTLIEAVTVAVRKRGDPGPRTVLRLVEEFDIDIAPTVAADAEIAADAYARFGKGQGHPAQLNFGDCFAYALAKRTGEPLLYTGNDFARTDIRVVPLPEAS